MVIIQPAFPCGERRIWLCNITGYALISIQVPAWEQRIGSMAAHSRGIFQSTFPLQGTTRLCPYKPMAVIISIHVPIAGNNEMPWEYVNAGGISIHVPIAGNDKADGGLADGEEISIHVPIAGNDLIVLLDRLHDRIFQSTFPLQGTTGHRVPVKFYRLVFQSTFPLQGTTLRLTNYSPSGKHFNPRSHCRERPADADSLLEYGTFQSTFPLQGTTIRRLCRLHR